MHAGRSSPALERAMDEVFAPRASARPYVVRFARAASGRALAIAWITRVELPRSCARRSPRALRRVVRRGLADWRLLLQIDTDEELCMTFGGRSIAFYIRRADLAAGKFDDVRVVSS